jgi:acyl-CoA synthetase (AMP-forming)/AMP-acid ligase II
MTWKDDRAVLRDEWRRQGWHGDEAIGEFIQRAAQHHPETLYHWDTPEGLKSASLGEICEAARRFAHALQSMGIANNEVVASQLPNSFEATVSICGVFMAGLTLLPMASSTGPADQRRALLDSRARVVIVPGLWRGRTLAERMDGALDDLDIICVGVRPDGSRENVLDWDDFCAAEASTPLPAVDADSRAILLYTSGSTAAPKAVQHSHNSTLVASRGTTIDELRFRPEFKYFIPSPVSHMAGVMFTLRPLVTAAPMLTVDTWSPERAFELCEEYQPDRMNASTFFFLSLFDHERAIGAVGGWPKSFNTGGATVPPSLIEGADAQGRHGWRSYGSSEIPATNAGNPLEPLYTRSLTDGRTQMGSEIKIVDDDEVGVPIGEVGEVFARGPQMFIGYVDEVATEAAFAPGGWFRTGDLGRLDYGGYLTIVGRKKDIVIRGGENLSTKEVEDVLAQHPMVLEVACLPVPDVIYGERMCAVVRVKSDSAEITIEEVRRFFKERGVSARKTPEVLAVYAEDWPRTSYGKVMKTDLLAKLLESGVLESVDGTVRATNDSAV